MAVAALLTLLRLLPRPLSRYETFVVGVAREIGGAEKPEDSKRVEPLALLNPPRRPPSCTSYPSCYLFSKSTYEDSGVKVGVRY